MITTAGAIILALAVIILLPVFIAGVIHNGVEGALQSVGRLVLAGIAILLVGSWLTP